MTHREKIREIAESACTSIRGQVGLVGPNLVEQAILAGIEAVLGVPATEKMIDAWFDAPRPKRDDHTEFEPAYRAMSAELIKELKC